MSSVPAGPVRAKYSTELLLSAGNEEARSLAANVDAGVVTLTGHADPETVTRVRNALRSITGVRRVFDVTGEGDES